MARSLRRRRSKLHVSVTGLTGNARQAFLILVSAYRFLFVVGAVGGLAPGHLAAAQPAPETPKKIVSSPASPALMRHRENVC